MVLCVSELDELKRFSDEGQMLCSCDGECEWIDGKEKKKVEVKRRRRDVSLLSGKSRLWLDE